MKTEIIAKTDSTPPTSYVDSTKLTLIKSVDLISKSLNSMAITSLKVIKFVLNHIPLLDPTNLNKNFDHLIESLEGKTVQLSPKPKTTPTPAPQPGLITRVDNYLNKTLGREKKIQVLFYASVLGIMLVRIGVEEAIPKINSFLQRFRSVPSCIAHYGTIDTLKEAQGVFECLDRSISWTGPEQAWETVKKIFRTTAMTFHPDKGGCPKIFERITDAYSFIKSDFFAKREQVEIFNCLTEAHLPQALLGCTKITFDNCNELAEKLYNLGTNFEWMGNTKPAWEKLDSIYLACIGGALEKDLIPQEPLSKLFLLGQ